MTHDLTHYRVSRCSRCYGIGSNPDGGRYIAIQDTITRDRIVIHERLVSSGRVPIDGGRNPEFESLAKALRGLGHDNPWTAPGDAIIRAWPHAPVATN